MYSIPRIIDGIIYGRHDNPAYEMPGAITDTHQMAVEAYRDELTMEFPEGLQEQLGTDPAFWTALNDWFCNPASQSKYLEGFLADAIADYADAHVVEWVLEENE